MSLFCLAAAYTGQYSTLFAHRSSCPRSSRTCLVKKEVRGLSRGFRLTAVLRRAWKGRLFGPSIILQGRVVRKLRQWFPRHAVTPCSKAVPRALAHSRSGVECKRTQLLYVLPPFTSLVVMCMDHLGGLIEAHLIVYQRVNAENFSEGRSATEISSHVHSCSNASESYLGRKLWRIELVHRA